MFAFFIIIFKGVTSLNRVNNHKRKQSKSIPTKVKRASMKKDEEVDIEIKVNKKGESKVISKPIKEKKKKKPKKENGPIKRIFRKFFKWLLIFLIIFSILFFINVKRNGGGLKGVLCTVLGQKVENVDALERINVLLLGISEDINKKLTDTIIVCSYDPKINNAFMISIPRDTFVGTDEATAKGSEKINALYSKNPNKAVEAVEKIIGMDIDYYAVFNNNAVIKIVDIIGGVNFDVPIDMDYDDPTQDLHIHLNSGYQNINGNEAEQLLRFRHNNDGSSYPAEYGDNDFGRMKTQRNFIMETVKQTLSFKNVLNSKNIINTVFENIETDLDIDKALAYVPAAVNLEIDTITNYQLPGESKRCNDLWFFIADETKINTLLKDLGIKE